MTAPRGSSRDERLAKVSRLRKAERRNRPAAEASDEDDDPVQIDRSLIPLSDTRPAPRATTPLGETHGDFLKALRDKLPEA